MRQIRVNKRTDVIASEYYEEMEFSNICEKAHKGLGKLLGKFTMLQANGCTIQLKDKVGNNTVPPKIFVDYIWQLLKDYSNLQTLRPNLFDMEIKTFENILSADKVKCKFRCKEQEGDNWEESLANQIVEAMGYKDVREKIYPTFIRKFGVKTCVYCNANYAITDTAGNAYYDLDHWKPKAFYPYFCTSFYNLQPACPSCNRRKRDDSRNEYFHLWRDSPGNNLEPFRFYLRPESIINYLIGFKKSGLPLEIKETSVLYMNLVKTAKEVFHLDAVYEEHRDVLEEILWKHKIYNDSYLSVTEELLRGIGIGGAANYKSIRDRFIMGNYCNPEDIHKRPLSKMTQDIGRQLGLV